MKKKMVVFGSLAIGFMVTLLATGPLAVVHAAELSDELAQFKNITYEIFGNTEIESCEYLYGLDNFSDYIYVDFKDKGYVIYHKDSMEMLEYSPTGDGPYNGIEERKYYAGPSNYYIKEEGGFVNVSNHLDSVVSESQAQSLAVQVNQLLYGDTSNDSPDIDEENLIPATPPGTATVGYINNAQYFVSNPMHGFNRHGTCGSVAAQLLLEYNNYYHDRRIIVPEHLNGGWNNANGNNDLFDVGNYTFPSQNPYVCSNPTTMSRTVLGSNLDYYQHIIGNIEPGALECVDTVTEYTVDEAKTTTTVTVTKEYPDGTSELISTETRPYQEGDEEDPDPEHTHNGSYGSDVIDGLENILKARIPENEFEIKHSKKSGTIDSAPIKAEIDAGRPLIIGMQESLGGMNHWVVGYGYQSYTYPEAHQNAGETYSGYVVHFGWNSSENNIWINESWCNEYIALEVKHEHDLNVDTEKNIGNDKREIRCGECGFRTVDELYTMNSEGNMITGCRYDLTGQVTVPSRINGVTVTAIGASAFENQIGITNIVLPSSITKIGNNAFANCEGLTNISIPSSIAYIGERAFTGCNNLNITVSANNPNYSAEGNILYNQTKTKIVATGRTEQEIVIPDAVTEIMPYAFAENRNLVSVRFASTPKIGEYAFHHCPNLNAVYFDSYEVPVIGENSFSDNNFVLYTRYNAQEAYREIFASYTNRIESLPLTITFMTDGQIYDIKTVYNGSKIADLPEPTRTGYEFNGWYDNDAYSGNPYQNGQLWESESDFYVYAKWTPKQSTVTLDADGGMLSGANSFSVHYGEPYSTSVTVSKTGYTFEGWYDENKKRYMTALGQGVDVWDKEDAAVTLKAHWAVECYEIRIDDDGSIVWVKASGISDTSCTIEYGTSLNAINLVPIYKASNHGFKEGKIFDHFEYKDSTLDWTSVPDLGDNGAVITIKPCWVYEVHTIYFNANYESGSEVKEIKVMFDEAVTLPEIDRIGYIFNGWFESLSDNIRITWLRMPDLTPDEQNNGSTMLYAKWTPITYTVSYKPNGGAGVMSSSTHTYDVYKNLNANAFYKTGHDFVGWATSQSGGAKYADKASVVNLSYTDAGNVTLYAVWNPKTYNIIYKNLMPDMSVFPNTYTYGIGLTPMPTLYRKSGYGYSPMENFYGWYSSSSFTTKVNSISSTSTGNVTLYAKYDYWICSTYASYTHTVTDGKIENQPCHGVNIMCPIYYNDVTNTTLKKIKITFSMDIWEIDDGYQEFYLYHEDKIIWETTMEHGPKKDTSIRNYTFTIILDINEYRNVDWLDLKFGAHGYMGDTWQFNNFELSVYFIN